jgi:hypothetical protein
METFQENIVKFKFAIDRFSKYYIEEHREVCSKSVVNFDSEKQKSEWHLVFYPDGKDFVDEGFCSLFLELLEKDQKEIRVQYRIYIVDIFGDEINVKESEVLFTEAEGWGYNNFIRQETLFENKCLLFPDGVLTLGCDFTILPKKKPNLKPFPLLNAKLLDVVPKIGIEEINAMSEFNDKTLTVMKYSHKSSGIRMITGFITDGLKRIKNKIL